MDKRNHGNDTIAKVAVAWDAIWRHRDVSEYDRRYWQFICENAGVGKGARILEAGCGSCRCLKAVSEKTPGLSVFGVDFSRESLKLGETTLKEVKPHKLVYSDVRKMPFEDGYFDLVFNSGVIEHLVPPQDSVPVREMIRVTNPGGTLIVLVPTRTCLWLVAGKKLLKATGKYPYGYEREYTRPQLKRLFPPQLVTVEKSVGIQLLPPQSDGFRSIYPSYFKRIGDLGEVVPHAIKSRLAMATGIIARKL